LSLLAIAALTAAPEKHAFTGVFNPLARKFDQPQWRETDF
jgi:hypothetical protein